MAPPTFNPWPLLDSKLSLAVQLHSLPIFMAGNIAWGIAIYYTVGSLIGLQLALRVAQKISTGQLKFILHSVTIALLIQLVIRVEFL